ncbi:MAG: protein-disulfide reductase DsbD [Sulfurimonas sp.]|jgi:thiol:disulfide interchange protein DsbD
MKKIILLLLSSLALIAAQPKFLMPDEAFKPSATLNERMQIEATIFLGKDIYLYAEAIKLELKDSDGIKIENIETPKSVEHDGDNVYLKSPTFLITLSKDANIDGIKNVTLDFSFQGCSEQGLCYEPDTKSFSFEVDTSKLDVVGADKKSTPKVEVKTETKVEKKELSETDSIADTIKSGSIALVLATFLGFGLLLALTPCTFPMVPIISGIIISQGEGITTKKAFMLSLVYVLAMAVAYTIAGVLAGLFGSNLQATLQAPWAIYTFSAIFVALALSMFGYYELKLPDSFVAKISSKHHTNRSGYAGVAVMGFLSALIVGPCVAAPLAGALVYIGQTGDALLGGAALFAMSMGMGLPLILVGVSAGKFMPRPGAWMTMVTAVFGVMMLGVAIWMLSRVVDENIIALLSAMLGIGFAVYFGAFDKEAHIFRRTISIVIFIYSVSLFLGLMAGVVNMQKPLEFLKSSSRGALQSEKPLHVEFKKVTSISELDVVLNQSKGKKIILDFSAEWCAVCKELDKKTFSVEAVKTKMSEFVLIRADVTQNSDEQKALSKKYGVFGPPVIIFFDKDTNVISSKTVVGFMEADNFLEHLNSI